MHDQRQRAHTLPALQALHRHAQWVCWRSEMRSGRWTKVPYHPRTGRHASCTDPATWSSYHEALFAWQRHPQRYDGMGYMFHHDVVGVDLDHCLDASGQIEPWTQAILRRLRSYAEYSPSRMGIHLLLWGTIPKGLRLALPSSWPHSHPKAAIEIYGQGRYFTVTGWQVAGMPATIERRQEALDALYRELTRTRIMHHPPEVPSHPTILPDDEQLLQKAMAASNGEKFRALFAGETTGYLSASEADLALCLLLAFWTGRDPARIDRLFRQSGLLRDKWESRRGASTYGQDTIQKAIALCQGVYAPGHNGQGEDHAAEG